VLEAQSEWRRRWEVNTTAFVLNDLQPALAEARRSTALFIGADEQNLAFVRNASTGVASVVRSIEPELRAGDEFITTAQDYNAIRQTLEFTAERFGARVVVAQVPFPLESPDQVTEAILAVAGPRTRLAVIDHITSPTALVFPIEEIVTELEPEVPVLVDGAHGPGQVPLDVETLEASWYTGNLHKWTCAPKGAAFLHARSDRRAMTVPTVISHGRNAPIPEGSDRFQPLFDWLGTDDFSQWLVVPDALAMVERLESGGWPAVMKRNHELILAARRLVADAVGSDLPAPDEMIGTMAAIPLADASGPDPGGELSPLMGELVDAGYGTLVMNWPSWPSQLLRISAHHYNRIDEYAALAEELGNRLRGE
jgi:isopenicillin-N epimerase